MDGRRMATLAWAEPQIVGRDRPDLADEDERRDPRPKILERLECSTQVAPVEQVFRLKLVAGARDVLEPEVRKTVVPRPRDAALDRACISGIARDRVQVALCQPAAEALV